MFKRKKDKSRVDSDLILVYESQTEHCQSIINELLYDTEKSKKIIDWETADCMYAMFLTNNGRWFKCKSNMRTCTSFRDDEKRHKVLVITEYSEIYPLAKFEAKRILGEENTDKYIKYFGDVEEA